MMIVIISTIFVQEKTVKSAIEVLKKLTIIR